LPDCFRPAEAEQYVGSPQTLPYTTEPQNYAQARVLAHGAMFS
jgi:hypothetical protein